MKKISQEVILLRFHEAHGDTYNYSLVNYTNMKTEVKIICKEHGPFDQLPDNHQRGFGCKKCDVQKRLIPQETIINQFIEAHGDTYGYAMVEYINTNTKVKIICKEHGMFEQEPIEHKRGHGCLKCYERAERFNGRKTYVGRDVTLYYIKIIKNNVTAYKIGLTMKTVKSRYHNDIKDGLQYEVLKTWKYYGNAEDGYDREQKIINTHLKFIYEGSPLLVVGNSELFSFDILKLDTTPQQKTNILF